MTKKKLIVILREHDNLRNPDLALTKGMHTKGMTYANWALSYQQICDRLGLESGISIRHKTLDTFQMTDEIHKIAICGLSEEMSNIEKKLYREGGLEFLKRCMNPKGQEIIKDHLREGKDPTNLRNLLGNGLYIFGNNKVLTYQALNHEWEEVIPLVGYGHRNKMFKGQSGLNANKKFAIKPVDRSHGEGIEFLNGDEVDLINNPYAIFGSHMIQDYVQTPKELTHLPHTFGKIKDSKLKLCTDMRVMPTALDKGYGIIGHIRVAINSNGKANLSQDAPTVEQRAYAIGLNPNIPITNKFDREICEWYGVDPNRPKVPKKLAQRSAEIATILGRPLIGADFGLCSENKSKPKYKLFEVNITPGSAILSYYGATKSKELKRFVKKENLGKYVDNLSVDQLNFDRDEIAAHRVVDVLCKTRAFLRVRVDEPMNALGLDNFIYGGDYKW